MKGTNVGLAILLGASVLLNAVLLLRRPEPGPEPRAAGPERERSDGAPVAPSRELEIERARTASLEARVKQLESEKTPTALVPADRLASFREGMRTYFRYLKKLQASGGEDAEDQLEFQAGYLEVYKVLAQRLKDPALYVDALRAFYEIALEEGGKPMTAGQKAKLSQVLDAYAGTLRELAAAPALDRFVKDIEMERDALDRMESTLTPEQREGLREKGAMLGGANGAGMQWSTRNDLQAQIVGVWSRAYGTGDVQRPALEKAAAAYAASLDRILEGYKGRENVLYGNDAEAYEYRLAAARAQVEAIRLFQGSLSAEQLERLRTRSLQQFHVYGGDVFQAEAEEKK